MIQAMEAEGGFSIRRAGAERILELEPLWQSLQDNHRELPDVPPVRTGAESWPRRRRQYERWLTGGGGMLFVAEAQDRLIGYLVLMTSDGPPTWDVGERVAEVETVAVLPEARSAGVGTALMKAAVGAAQAEGATAIAVGVAHSNAEAIRWYERDGFEPFYVTLLRR